MKSQVYRMALLYDFYSGMLTDHQRKFYDFHYNKDFSLAEIVENYGIARQGVRDATTRAEVIPTELENRTGTIHCSHGMQKQFGQMERTAGAIAQRNEAHWQGDELGALYEQLKGILAQLKRE